MLPSGSWKIAWWQTPLSMVSPMNETPFDSSSARAASTSSTWNAIGTRLGWNSMPSRSARITAIVTVPVSNSAPSGSSEPHVLDRCRPSTSP